MFHDTSDFHSELIRWAVEGNTTWAEWYWFSNRCDGTLFGMRRVALLGIQEDQIEWAHFDMEPV